MEALLATSIGILILIVLLQVLMLWRQNAVLDLAPLVLRLETIERLGERSERAVREEVSRNREETLKELLSQRQELQTSMASAQASLVNQLGVMSTPLLSLTETVDQKLELVRNTVQERLKTLQDENAGKLDQIRHTVDEQLQSTLEKRLGESFQVVTERLEQVHRGLGEMQSMASGVGDLKKLLSNVRVRGTWGEVQLRMLLEQVLAPEQYGMNVAVGGQGELVDFAIKLPGSGPGESIWLPIDVQFPREEYERVLTAVEHADPAEVELCSRELEDCIRRYANELGRKHLAPPATTDFAILYLPTESVYSEVLRRPGLVEFLQREYRVTVAGPVTLAALLNSLQMGFKTLAIQRRSTEVWEVLSEVKVQFSKYADILSKVQRKLQEANHTVEAGLTRTRVLQRKLKVVEVPDAPTAVAPALEETQPEPMALEAMAGH